MKSLADLALNEYTLLLDRDGVINEPKPDDYVKHPDEFIFTPNALEAIGILQDQFKHIIIVTNQQGIGRDLMTDKDLENIHLKMYDAMRSKGLAYFDHVFYAPYLRTENHSWRKPSTGMLEKASEYLDLDPDKLLMCGDSPGDMELGRSLHAICVKISNPQFDFDNSDYEFGSLSEFAQFITQS